MPGVTTTYEALEEWLDLIRVISPHWGDLMDEAWVDLPPDVTETLLVAANAIADAHEVLAASFSRQCQEA